MQEIDHKIDHTYNYIYSNSNSYEPLAQVYTENGEQVVNYFHCDQIGIPREMTDSQGNIIWKGSYYVWGQLKRSHENYTAHQPFRLQNQYFDKETGLHYNFFRYYNPILGRFVNQDPIGFAGGENLYRFANNAQHWIDPLGLETFIINRDLAVLGSSARSRANPITHTFVAISDNNGRIIKTYSWGNDANLRGWNVDQELDLTTAQQALDEGLAGRVADRSFDYYVHEAFDDLNIPENEHANWFLVNNCKAETKNLLERARELQRQNNQLLQFISK
ncbi:RHS repeat domain-containing protein [Actinobacillus vicugnae]|uniref:RHS repeat domain-containing protein n=1 Tax=Actinobacillus vicugnae TaxID=2573093 RepID=UPI001FCC2518|nr:RHS repeat-associated core domain-containing protein [Actinobacillus vicugnae]